MTKKELTLISGGRVSKKDFVLGAKYEDASGKAISFPFIGETKTESGTFQPSQGYYKVRRAGKGEKIFRTRMKKAYSMNLVITGIREGRKYEITHTVYLYTDVDDEKEAERLLKKVWSEKTTFPIVNPDGKRREFTVEDDVEFDAVGEDQFQIKTKYLEDAEREYQDTYEAKVTQTRLVLTNIEREFSDVKEKSAGVKKIGGKKYGWLKIDK